MNCKKTNPIGAKRTTFLIIVSGIVLGIAIFTKIPIFTMIPLVGYLVTTCSNKQFKTIGLWIMPVILIPLIWPLHAMITGELKNWVSGVLTQTHRESQPLINSINSAFQVDSILLILGVIGITYAIAKRDSLIILWVFPFLIFLYLIGYVSYWHLIPLIPALCISAARLIVDLSDKVRFKYIRQLLPYAIVTAIGILGLVNSLSLIVGSGPSRYFESVAFVGKYLRENAANTNDHKSLVIISEPTYTWILQRVFHLNYTYDALPLSTSNVTKALLIADKPFIDETSGISASSANLRKLYNDSIVLTTIGPNSTDAVTIRLYDLQDAARKMLESCEYNEVK